MDTKYYTIGMAGHIDHGKTTLTKALTNVDTDRLKEEKERNISIELGYAPLHMKDNMHVSVVDVPGHERFIRQMIAGVAGIDLVLLVIAADEGTMPQTKEHIEILEFLGIKRCIVVITKIDTVDEEFLEIVTLDIQEQLASTVFHDASVVYADSISKKGIDELKEKIFYELNEIETRDSYGSFRLPIDQVFTVQGQGTVVRGTIYEGLVRKGSPLIVLPQQKKVKARQIQVHHQETDEARAGQRTAINLGGITKEEVQRGDVLVSSDHFLVTKVIDVSLKFVDEMNSPIKQRSLVKIHVGTSEVMGTIVFFDRNEVKQTSDEVLCQLRLHEEVVVRRGDRFILRRPTPVETVGGGWVIDPKGEKYRFGVETIEALMKKKEGTPEDRLKDVLFEYKLLDMQQIMQYTSLNEHELHDVLKKEVENNNIIEMTNDRFILSHQLITLQDELVNAVKDYHEQYPMRIGINKAELVQSYRDFYPKLYVEFAVEKLVEKSKLKKSEQYIALQSFASHFPKKWEKRMNQIIDHLKSDGIAVKRWEEYVKASQIPEKEIVDLQTFLLQSGEAYKLDEHLLVHKLSFEKALSHLKQETEQSFDLKTAKEILELPRKYLIPFLELLDELKLTSRLENERKWVKLKQ
ncbi:selenocysteine-specific translation elongation factor [Bacillus taeanensis]|uniref:Selenocysteine-specific elongation factor n=1 Tax=Bacillus taeanensis TaxID=273032 RepID=A0A366XVI9_9BACI|nr:selenocysteine-specific translation elongation factor [Bacillus taeanensis]RBW69588.1 selenocysteine-specific translation elongation factor [Bacillus taeanensis]